MMKKSLGDLLSEMIDVRLAALPQPSLMETEECIPVMDLNKLVKENLVQLLLTTNSRFIDN
jgi:hypothetical protein